MNNYINGNGITESDAHYSNINPATGEVLNQFPQSTQEEVLEAVNHAKVAATAWRNTSRVKRAEYFSRIASIARNEKR